MAIDWSLAEIADALAQGLARASEEDRVEQAVRGLDSLAEVQLHSRLADVLAAAGYGVEREQRYLGQRSRRRRSEGQRCDLVLTPRGLPLEQEEAAQTLFAPPGAVVPAEALWLEVKVVVQFTEDGPNRSYASDLQQPVRQDVAKLARDSFIAHAAVLLVLFTADETTARHDLDLWGMRCAERGLDVAPPCVRHIPIVDRLGNSVCTVALFRVRGW